MKPRKEVRKVSARQLAKHPELLRGNSTIVRSSSPGPRKPKSLTPIKRSRIKPKPRKPSEFARIYGSRERVRFIKSLPCCLCCGIALSDFAPDAGNSSDNAHTGERSGMGRKADFDTIVPMCRLHHRRFDTYDPPFNIEECREAIQALGPKIEQLWVLHRANWSGR
jgi:hypothetical protein